MKLGFEFSGLSEEKRVNDNSNDNDNDGHKCMPILLAAFRSGELKKSLPWHV